MSSPLTESTVWATDLVCKEFLLVNVELVVWAHTQVVNDNVNSQKKKKCFTN